MIAFRGCATVLLKTTVIHNCRPQLSSTTVSHNCHLQLSSTTVNSCLATGNCHPQLPSIGHLPSLPLRPPITLHDPLHLLPDMWSNKGTGVRVLVLLVHASDRWSVIDNHFGHVQTQNNWQLTIGTKFFWQLTSCQIIPIDDKKLTDAQNASCAEVGPTNSWHRWGLHHCTLPVQALPWLTANEGKGFFF